MDWLIFQDPQKYDVKDPRAAVSKIEKAGIILRSMGNGVLWANDPLGQLDESKRIGKARALARTRLAGLRMCAQQISEYLESEGSDGKSRRRRTDQR